MVRRLRPTLVSDSAVLIVLATVRTRSTAWYGSVGHSSFTLAEELLYRASLSTATRRPKPGGDDQRPHEDNDSEQSPPTACDSAYVGDSRIFAQLLHWSATASGATQEFPATLWVADGVPEWPA